MLVNAKLNYRFNNLDNGVKIFKTTVGLGGCLEMSSRKMRRCRPSPPQLQIRTTKSRRSLYLLFFCDGAAVKGNEEMSSKPSTASDSPLDALDCLICTRYRSTGAGTSHASMEASGGLLDGRASSFWTLKPRCRPCFLDAGCQ